MDTNVADTKRDTLERMSLKYAHDNKALQRRVIRVSETFERKLKQRGRPTEA